ncbi:MAG: hypothetical protein AAGC55_04155, partial [Myxococcota bacterium]
RTPARLAPELGDAGFLGWLGDGIRFVGGEPENITLRGKDNPQMALCRSLGQVDCALLWFSQPVRQSYVNGSRERVAERVAAAGFTLRPHSAVAVLAGQPLAATPALPDPAAASRDLPEQAVDPLFQSLLVRAERFADTGDITTLARMDQDGRDAAELAVLWSDELDAAFLAIAVDGKEARHRAVVVLSDSAAQCDPDDGSSAAPQWRQRLLERRCRTAVAHLGAVEVAP